MIRRPPRSTLFPLHDALPISRSRRSACPSARRRSAPICIVPGIHAQRSEEHTSELQSQSNLVCRLLLEKKKNYEECKLRLQPSRRVCPPEVRSRSLTSGHHLH